MIEGATINMGGKDWIVPPLNLKGVKTLGPKLDAMNAATSRYELLPIIAEIALAALQRNYPDLTADQVEDLIDMGNSQRVVEAVLGQSGLKKAGEAPAVSHSP